MKICFESDELSGNVFVGWECIRRAEGGLRKSAEGRFYVPGRRKGVPKQGSQEAIAHMPKGIQLNNVSRKLSELEKLERASRDERSFVWSSSKSGSKGYQRNRI